MLTWTKPCEENEYLSPHVSRLDWSYAHWLGRPLFAPGPSDIELAARLFRAPFVVVSHNAAADPVFNYANQTALTLFEFTWDEFVALPSRLSAEPLHQAERDRLLALVTRQGYISDYSGIRVSKSGRRFRIEKAIVWNLLDEHGAHYGQAAMFSHWTFL